MKKTFELLLSLIKRGKIYIEDQTERPLLIEDLESSPAQYRPATKHDIPNIVISPAWYEMLASGRAFFAESAA